MTTDDLYVLSVKGQTMAMFTHKQKHIGSGNMCKLSAMLLTYVWHEALLFDAIAYINLSHVLKRAVHMVIVWLQNDGADKIKNQVFLALYLAGQKQEILHRNSENTTLLKTQYEIYCSLTFWLQVLLNAIAREISSVKHYSIPSFYFFMYKTMYNLSHIC